MTFRTLLICLALVFAVPAKAQDWGNLDALLATTLAPGELIARGYWLPDDVDPAQATAALGVVYPIIPEAAGNTGIAVGYFQKGQNGWGLSLPVTNLFGHQPRDAAFFDNRVEVTTLTLGPNDARCCPSMLTRWVIDRVSGQAQAMN